LDNLNATKNSSIADLRLKAKKHSATLGIWREMRDLGEKHIIYQTFPVLNWDWKYHLAPSDAW
jgi:hypothetical protein